MCNIYLVVAYGVLWGIFAIYASVLHRRQQRLERALGELRKASHE